MPDDLARFDELWRWARCGADAWGHPVVWDHLASAWQRVSRPPSWQCHSSHVPAPGADLLEAWLRYALGRRAVEPLRALWEAAVWSRGTLPKPSTIFCIWSTQANWDQLLSSFSEDRVVELYMRRLERLRYLCTLHTHPSILHAPLHPAPSSASSAPSTPCAPSVPSAPFTLPLQASQAGGRGGARPSRVQARVCHRLQRTVDAPARWLEAPRYQQLARKGQCVIS